MVVQHDPTEFPTSADFRSAQSPPAWPGVPVPFNRHRGGVSVAEKAAQGLIGICTPLSLTTLVGFSHELRLHAALGYATRPS